jgi:tRNA threonylcarbamoyladenosine biosynthesis protein TsaE
VIGNRRFEIAVTSPGAMQQIGKRIGRGLRSGDVVLLNGDLGAGKTTLALGIAAALGVTGPVQSPTFTLVAEHICRGVNGGPVRLYHLDLYRLRDESDLESFGYEQYLEPADGVSVIEWPERTGNWLPERYLLVDFTISGPSRRLIRIEAAGGFEIDLTELVASSDSHENLAPL